MTDCCPGVGTMAHVRGCVSHPERAAATATVPPVPMPRGELPDATRKQLERAAEKRDASEKAYRQTVVEALASASMREVANATGLSTNTLQRWKKESR